MMIPTKTKKEICPHFGVCGGCRYQDMPYEQQLRKKADFVFSSLMGIEVGGFLPILGSPEITYYRNKMEFSFGDSRDVAILNLPQIKPAQTRRERRDQKVEKKQQAQMVMEEALKENKVHLGLHPRKRFNLVTPTAECQLLSAEAQKIIQTIGDWATTHKIPSYTRHNGEGVLRHLVIREGKNTGERLVNLVSTSAVTHLDELVLELKSYGDKISTFLWSANDTLSDVARGNKPAVLWGNGQILEKVHGISISVPPHSFMQTNTHASENMIQLLKNWIKADLTVDQLSQARLFDLYCGVGTIGLCLADLFREVIGIESDAAAIDEAQQNAKENSISNIRFSAGKAEDLLAIFEGVKDDSVLIVDPPRPGLHPSVVQAILSSEIPNFYYVSCNPESLSRDLRVLEAKYRIISVQPMDFFPHTDHVETAVRLKRRI